MDRSLWWGVLAGVALVLLLTGVAGWWDHYYSEKVTHTVDRAWDVKGRTVLHWVHVRTTPERADLIMSRLDRALPCLNDQPFLGVPRLRLRLHSFGPKSYRRGTPVHDGELHITFVEYVGRDVTSPMPWCHFDWLLDGLPVPSAADQGGGNGRQ